VPSGAIVTDGGLERLIDTERRLADRLSAAATAAEKIAAGARREAAEALTRFESELAEATDALAARVSAERESEIATIRRSVTLEVARLNALSDDAIAAIASSLLDQAVGSSDQQR
jgi:hypothetical protein